MNPIDVQTRGRRALIPLVASMFLTFAPLACHCPSGRAHPPITSEQAIRSVLARDELIGKERNLNPHRMSLAESVRQYVEGMEAIDTSDCPDDFTRAFRRHQAAWVDLEQPLEQYGDLRGEMHDLFDIIEGPDNPGAEDFKPLVANIWSTWEEVQASLDRHGIVTD